MSRLTTSCLSYGFAGLLALTAESALSAQSAPDVAQQIAELMAQAPSGKAHQRYIHAKGIVCTGTFELRRRQRLSREPRILPEESCL